MGQNNQYSTTGTDGSTRLLLHAVIALICNVMHGSHVFCCTRHFYNTRLFTEQSIIDYVVASVAPRLFTSACALEKEDKAGSALFCKDICLKQGGDKHTKNYELNVKTAQDTNSNTGTCIH